MATAFVIFLLLTYSFGFNLLCSFNVQSTFSVYSFYHPETTPAVIGAILALLVGACVMGGAKAIEKAAGVLVPFMGVAYALVTIVVLVLNYQEIPRVVEAILSDAFNFRAIFSGIGGSCLVMGIKRGLYSNEAGVGSAPNAAAAATTSHPVKQGLVQLLSVYIDTVILCNATAFMCLVSEVPGNAENAGALWVQTSLHKVLGDFGPLFITVSMLVFSFTTLIGNIYYCENGLAYLNHKQLPTKSFMKRFHLYAVLIVFLGAIIPMAAAWDLADIMMGGMTLINLTACVLLSSVAVKTYQDYKKQKEAGLDPHFKASSIGLPSDLLDFWK
jgi:alanine or glycine:cation symporter, AGCS family